MEKSELIADLMDSLSKRFSEVRVEAERDQYRHEGASRELLKAAGNIVGLSTLVDDDVEKERYDTEVGQRIKNMILRASQMLVDAAKHEKNNQLVAQGRAQGVLDLVKLAQKQKEDAERKKAEREAAQQASEDEPVLESGRRPLGVHPGSTLKQKRATEEDVVAQVVVSNGAVREKRNGVGKKRGK